MQPIFAAIASGFNVSGDIDLRQKAITGIIVPTIGASGALAIQANGDQTSANFVRMLETRQPGSGDLLFATGVGSRYIPYPSALPTPSWARLEVVTAAGSLQSDTRTFTLLTRPR